METGETYKKIGIMNNVLLKKALLFKYDAIKIHKRINKIAFTVFRDACRDGDLYDVK